MSAQPLMKPQYHVKSVGRVETMFPLNVSTQISLLNEIYSNSYIQYSFLKPSAVFLAT